MPKFYDSLPEDLSDWALKQPVFYTASAPLTGKHVNISPKGLPSSTLTVFSPTTAAYIDFTGSGSETISHIYENGRITIMFCSFGSSPRIMRWFCTGRVVEWDMPEFQTLLGKMSKKRLDGPRAVIVLDIWKVSYLLSILLRRETKANYNRSKHPVDMVCLVCQVPPQ